MKKLAKLAALLAAAALLFGAVGCSGGDDDDPKSEPTLKSISVTANEDVKDHYNGDETEFDHTGLTVTAHYSDETTKDVTGDATFTATYEDEDGTEKEFPVAEKNIYEVTVTAHYEGMEDTLKDPIIITVGDVVLESISVSGTLTKKSYKQGADLDYTGITVKAHYDIGEPVSLSHSQVRFEATYNDGEEFTTRLEPNDYSVTITATYEGEKASLAEPVTITIEEASGEDDDDGEETYFKSFVASDDLGVDTDSESYTSFTSKDELVKILGRAKYQKTGWDTADYDETAGTGYTYTARVKINATDKNGEGKLTITKVKVGDVLRFDGGNAANNVGRKMNITGANKTEWEASAQGSFYLTATAETVVLESMTNEFCIYGIHVVDEEVEESVTDTTTTYEKPRVTLSKNAVVKNSDVTITAEIPNATKTTTYSTGRVATESVKVDAKITYTGAAVADNGKVDTSTEGTFTITASYTIGEDIYTSAEVTLNVAGGFETDEVTVTNDNLGLIAESAESSDTTVATVEKTSDGVKITSVEAEGDEDERTAVITVKSTDGKEAVVVVTVSLIGKITPKVYKYSETPTITWAIPDKDTLTGESTLYGIEVGDVEGYADKSKVAWATTSGKFKYSSVGNTQDTATFTTNLKKTANECISNGNYAQVEITNNTGAPVTLLSLAYTHAISDKSGDYGCQALYWIGDVTGEGTALDASTYEKESNAILTKADVSFADDVTVANGQKVTIRFAYYGGANGGKVCALKDVVLSVAK